MPNSLGSWFFRPKKPLELSPLTRRQHGIEFSQSITRRRVVAVALSLTDFCVRRRTSTIGLNICSFGVLKLESYEILLSACLTLDRCWGYILGMSSGCGWYLASWEQEQSCAPCPSCYCCLGHNLGGKSWFLGPYWHFNTFSFVSFLVHGWASFLGF